MAELEIKHQLDERDVADVEALLARVQAADGHQPIDEHRWVDAAHGGRRGFAGLVYRESGHTHPVGYAQVMRGARSWAVDVVIDPHHRYDALAIGPRLLHEALDVIAGSGGGHVHHWIYEPTAAHDRIAAEAGLRRGRDLWQMRVDLPLPETIPRTELPLRPFEPARDEEAWLEVNNAAFDWHPEQGDWTLDDLRSRQAEEWFDPAGFLLLDATPGADGGARLDGFCWTKVHAGTAPPMGEIYVIAVHPDAHGRGLGRALTVAGLDHLAGRGITCGMLYVDADNTAAVGLYRALGFEVHHTDRAYVGDIPPAPPEQASPTS